MSGSFAFDDLFAVPEESQKADHFFATVGKVYTDGVTLIIDGKETQKHYLVNTGCKYTAGAKVKVIKIDGTYIVEYVVGRPG